MALIWGIGIRDVDGPVTKRLPDGSRWRCPYYAKWERMIQRCYSEPSLERNPTYWPVDVSDEWLSFSAFRDWMQLQDWHGKHLDKDVIEIGNTTYSASKCCFLTPSENILFSTSKKRDLPVGVYRSRSGYRVEVMGGYFGHFQSVQEATRKANEVRSTYIRKVAKDQPDLRVKQGMLAHASLIERGEVL